MRSRPSVEVLIPVQEFFTPRESHCRRLCHQRRALICCVWINHTSSGGWKRRKHKSCAFVFDVGCISIWSQDHLWEWYVITSAVISCLCTSSAKPAAAHGSSPVGKGIDVMQHEDSALLLQLFPMLRIMATVNAKPSTGQTTRLKFTSYG